MPYGRPSNTKRTQTLEREPGWLPFGASARACQRPSLENSRSLACSLARIHTWLMPPECLYVPRAVQRRVLGRKMRPAIAGKGADFGTNNRVA